jgi:hypothetical protein
MRMWQRLVDEGGKNHALQSCGGYSSTGRPPRVRLRERRRRLAPESGELAVPLSAPDDSAVAVTELRGRSDPDPALTALRVRVR